MVFFFNGNSDIPPKKVDDDWGLVPMTKRTPHIDTYRMAIKSQDMAMANQIEHQIKKTNRIQWNKNTTHEFYFWDVLAVVNFNRG